VTLSSSRNQDEYRVAEKFIDSVDSRWFSPDVFALALVEMGGRATGVIFRTFMLYIDNLCLRAESIDTSEVDDDTLDALDQAIRLREVLTQARRDGRL
jgi:hypothetical protein